MKDEQQMKKTTQTHCEWCSETGFVGEKPLNSRRGRLTTSNNIQTSHSPKSSKGIEGEGKIFDSFFQIN